MTKILDHLEEWLIATLMGVATIIIFIAVLHRYASSLPIPGVQDWLLRLNTSWAQELTIYLFVWMAKFGAAYGVRTGIHVGVDVIVNRLPEGRRRAMVLFGLMAGALFTGLIAAFGADFVFELSSTSSTSEVLELPIWIVTPNRKASSRPGTTPAMNSLPTEVLVDTEYITITIDGGIRMPSAPEVVITPAPKRFG